MKYKSKLTTPRTRPKWLGKRLMALWLGVLFILPISNVSAQCPEDYTATDLITSGTIDIDINGATACADYPFLEFNSIELQAGAVLDIDFISPYVPTAGTIFTLFKASTITGTFTSLIVPTISGLSFEIDYSTANQIRLLVKAPEIELIGNSTAIALGDATPDLADHTDFGGVNWSGTGTIVRTFTISNASGTADLTIASGGITITGTNATEFTFGGLTLPATIPAGDQTTFTVTFDPTAAGVREAMVNIASNDLDNTPIRSPYTFAIQGTGTQPSVQVTGNSNVIITDNSNLIPSLANHTISVPTSVGFSSSRTFTLQNVGDGPLTISDIIVSVPFSLTSPSVSSFPLVLAPSGTQDIEITFSPTSHGSDANKPLFNVLLETDVPILGGLFTFRFQGNTKIQALPKNNITVNLNGLGNATLTGASVDSASIDNSGVANILLSYGAQTDVTSLNFTCADLGTRTITFKAIASQFAAEGDEDMASVTVNVVDNVAPNVLTKNITVQLDASGNATITPADVDNNSTDACGIDTRSLDITSFNCSNVGANTVTLTVTDVNGNSANDTATVTVEDNIAPNVLTKNITVQLDASGNATIAPADVDDNSTDACGIHTRSLDITSFNCSNVGANTVTLTVTDVNGNSANDTATVTVEDNIAPNVLTKNITVQLDASGNATIAPADVDNNSTDACGIDTRSLNITSFNCSNVGANTVTLTVTDVNGNSANDTATVTVEDNIAPNVLTKNITVQLDASGNATIAPADVDDNSTDACGISSRSLDITSFDCSNVGPNTVTLTVVDVNGNSANATATVTVEDMIPPTVLTQDITVQLDATGNVSISATDIDNGSSDNCTIHTRTLDVSSFNCSNLGANTVTLTVTDVNGNSANATATVTVEDNINPIISGMPADVTADAVPNNCGKVIFWAAPTASDNCTVASFTSDFASGELFPVGITTVTYTAIDNSGNKTTASFTITIEDKQAPTITGCPANITRSADQNCEQTASWVAPIASDNCAGVSITSTHVPGDMFPFGTTTVTYTATDASGNTSTCSFDVIVIDDTKPTVITKNLTIQLDASGSASISVSDIDNGSFDNCGVDTRSLDKTSFDCSNVGANTVTLTVTDINGNIADATATVTVEDKIAPSVMTQNITVQLDATGNVSITAMDIDNGSSDNCSIDTRMLDKTTFDCSNVGANTVTLTVTDVNGNSANATATVTVEDNMAPMVMTQNITVQLDATGNASITAMDIDNGSSDNCAIDTRMLDITSFDCSNVGTPVTVTLTVTDVNGNSANATATVTVQDNMAPMVMTQNITVQLDATGNVSITAMDIDNGSSDNCGIDTRMLDITSFNCSNVGANTVTLTVTDINGNSANATATVTVQDNMAPMVMTQNITVQLDATGNVSITAMDIDNGSSDNCSIDTRMLDKTTFDCSNVGANTVTLTVTDVNGNSANATATVTVEDNMAPMVMTQNITVQLDATGNASITAMDIDNGSSDNCSIDTRMLDITSFTCSNVGTPVTVTLTVTDVNGNSANATATVTVEDNMAPMVMTQNITVQLDATGNVSITAMDIDNGSSDNCGIDTRVLDITSFNCGNVGANTVTLTVTDINGNSANATATVTVQDNMAPMVMTQNITVQLDATGNVSITAMDIDNGSSDNCSIASLNLDKTTFDCSNVGANTVTLTVTDVNGNSANATATVTVEDNMAPMVMTKDITVQLDATGNASITAMDIDNGSSDNCAIDTRMLDITSFTCSNVGTPVTVTLTVTDVNGNSANATATVTVEDVKAPVFDAIFTNQNVVTDNSVCTYTHQGTSWDATATDNCNVASITAEITGASAATNLTTLDQFVFAKGLNIVKWTAIDVFGNSESFSFDVLVEDNQAPIFNTALAGFTVTTDLGVCTYTHSGTAWDSKADDNCGVAKYTYELTNATNLTGMTSLDGVVFNQGTTNVKWTATDTAGNFSVETFVVTVNDEENPVFSNCPTNLVLNNLVNNCSQHAYWTRPGVSDNCGVATVELRRDGNLINSVPFANYSSLGNLIGELFPVGTTRITYIATDIHGNVDSCFFTIEVKDVQFPEVVNVPANITRNVTTGQCGTNVAWLAPTMSDNCPGVITSATHLPGDFFPVGTTTVTYTATDAAGNVTSKSFDVTVIDNENPKITCPMPSMLTFGSAAGLCGANVNFPAATATDNCEVDTIIYTVSGNPVEPGNFFNVGSTQVLATATDIYGNTATCTFNVVVNDVESPVFTACPSDVNLNNDPGVCGAVYSYTLPATTDNCPAPVNVTLQSGLASGSVFPVGTTTLTFLATDAYGNTATCSYKVIVTDNEAPVVNTNSITIQLNSMGEASITEAQINNASTDNCGIANITLDKKNFACVDLGPNIVTLTVTDIHGNSGSNTATVTVEDKIAPIAICKPATVFVDASGTGTLNPADINDGSNDNCTASGNLNLALSQSVFTCADLGQRIVTLTVTDASGNSSTCQSIITVIDNVAPVITSTPSNIVGVVNDPGVCGAVVNYPAATATDQCGVTITYSQNSGTVFAVGTTTVTVFATDGSGNTTTSSFSINVIDTERPKFTNCPANIEISNLLNNCSQHAYWTPPVISDNCAVNTVSVRRDGQVVTTVPFANVGVLNAVLIGEIFPVGTTRITYVATDIYNNVDSCFFTIKVNDTQKPQIKGMPANLVLSMDKGFCYATGTWAEPTATDNCPGVVLTTTQKPGFQFPLGITTVTYTATDAAGNTDIQSFTVTVSDNELPVIAGSSNIVDEGPSTRYINVSNNPGVCGAIVNYEITATDNCPTGLVLNQTAGLASGSLFPVGTTTVSFEATDAVGNKSTYSFTVNVSDTEKPIISGCPKDIEGENIVNDPGTITRVVVYNTPTATDNCPGLNFTLVEGLPSGSAFPLGRTKVVYVATDAAGNRDSCIFNVRVNYRNEQPAIIANNPPTVLEDAGKVVVSNWATFQSTTILPANSIEAAQQPLRYVVSNISNPNLFISAPEVDLTGTLRYELAANENGSSTFDIFVQDDGGNLFGGVDISQTLTFTINVTPVNDQPTLDPIADFEVNATADITLPLTGISSGAFNEDQIISITAASSNPAILPNPTVIYTSPNETGSITFKSNLNQTGPVTITLTVTDNGDTQNGGVNTLVRTFNVLVKVSDEIYLPTLFTPNGDNVNDRFIVRGNGIEDLEFQIFDREGNLVYETKNVIEALTTGWDGKMGGQDAPQGIYMWRLTGSMVNDGALKVRSFVRNTGEVQLVR